MARSAQSRRSSPQYWLWFAVLILALYVVVPQLGSFRHSLVIVSQANPALLLAAVAASVLSFGAAAAIYCALAAKPLGYGQTLLVEIASMFVNRLLPAGIGAVGTNYIYLRRRRHNRPEAVAVVTLNNGLGMVGHAGLVGAGLLLYRQQLPPLRFQVPPAVALIAGLLVVIAIAVGFSFRQRRQRLAVFVATLWRHLAAYRRRLTSLALGLAASLALTVTTVAAFWLSCQAVHINLSPIAALLVFSFGVALGTAVPTPGGVGAWEAGLTAGLVAFQVAAAPALAAALLYRLISYWLPLVYGALAFTVLTRNQTLKL